MSHDDPPQLLACSVEHRSDTEGSATPLLRLTATVKNSSIHTYRYDVRFTVGDAFVKKFTHTLSGLSSTTHVHDVQVTTPLPNGEIEVHATLRNAEPIEGD